MQPLLIQERPQNCEQESTESTEIGAGAGASFEANEAGACAKQPLLRELYVIRPQLQVAGMHQNREGDEAQQLERENHHYGLQVKRDENTYRKQQIKEVHHGQEDKCELDSPRLEGGDQHLRLCASASNEASLQTCAFRGCTLLGYKTDPTASHQSCSLIFVIHLSLLQVLSPRI